MAENTKLAYYWCIGQVAWLPEWSQQTCDQCGELPKKQFWCWEEKTATYDVFCDIDCLLLGILAAREMIEEYIIGDVKGWAARGFTRTSSLEELRKIHADAPEL